MADGVGKAPPAGRCLSVVALSFSLSLPCTLPLVRSGRPPTSTSRVTRPVPLFIYICVSLIPGGVGVWQLLREAESILNPEEPWPYAELIVDDLPTPSPAEHTLADTRGTIRDEEQSLTLMDAEVAMASPSAFLPERQGGGGAQGGEGGGDHTQRAQSSRQPTEKSGKKRSRGGGSLSARVQERQRASGGARSEDGSAGSASEHSRATTPAGETPVGGVGARGAGSPSSSASGEWQGVI